MRVLVTGATGFIGRHLIPELIGAGHDVVAMTRHPDAYDGPGTPIGADVSDEESLIRAMRGVDAAYYLVHSLESDDFEDQDARAATELRHRGRRRPPPADRLPRRSGRR